MIKWQEFPKQFCDFYSQINTQKPYISQLTGGFQGQLTADTETMQFWAYYPENLGFSSQNVILLLPNHADVSAFLESSGWKTIADRDKILLLAICIGTKSDVDESRISALMKEQKNRRYMDTKQPLTYLACYGKAAAAGYHYLLQRTEEFGGAAFLGAVNTGEPLMADAGTRFFGSTDLPRSEIPCPVLFGDDQCWDDFAGVTEYWCHANLCQKEPFIRDGLTWYLPDYAKTGNCVSNQPVSELVLAPELKADAADTAEKVWVFLKSHLRGTGINYGDMHPWRSMEQMGMVRHELIIDGYTRYWYEYVPERTQVLTDGKLPVVIYLHGGSASVSSDGVNHEWAHVAKERGFVLLLPAGTMRVTSDMMPHPAWNAAELTDHMNDEKFLKAMLLDVQNRLPTDVSRTYITGHSMGSAMAQRLALSMPQLFAAAAGNSGVTKGGFMGDFDLPGVREDYPIPLWVQMGENDYGGGTMENNPAVDRAMRYWAGRYHLDADNPGCWRFGRYLNKEWSTASGVPMLRLTTTLEKPHCITPQDPWLYYDQFFCHFSRSEDGVLLYHGKPVQL